MIQARIRPPRLVDVAALAGVSPATASLALNGGRVSASARARVQAAAEQLHYIPRASAQALKTGRSRSLAMWVLSGPNGTEVTEDSAVFYPLIRGVLDIAQEHGLGFSFHVHAEPLETAGARLAEAATRTSPAAFIVVPLWRTDGSYAQAIRQLGTPVVSVNDSAGDAHVDVDHEAGIGQAVRHLADSGHTEVGYLAGPEGQIDAERKLAAFHRSAAEWGLWAPSHAVRRVEPTITGGREGMRALLADCAAMGLRLPGAMLAADDYAAAGMIQEAVRAGLRVPEDLSVVGYGDLDVSRALTPTLTTVRQPLPALGRAAARAAVALARGTDLDRPTSLFTQLIRRDSVERLRTLV